MGKSQRITYSIRTYFMCCIKQKLLFMQMMKRKETRIQSKDKLMPNIAINLFEFNRFSRLLYAHHGAQFRYVHSEQNCLHIWAYGIINFVIVFVEFIFVVTAFYMLNGYFIQSIYKPSIDFVIKWIFLFFWIFDIINWKG